MLPRLFTTRRIHLRFYWACAASFYLFDHRQWNTAVNGQTLREWFIHNLTISETGLLHPGIDGL